jgi:hypothetical protein
MKRNHFAVRCLVPLFGLLVLLGCSGSAFSDEAASVEQTLVSHCQGTYICDFEGSLVETMFSSRSGSCYLGQIELLANGTGLDSEGDSYTWYGNLKAFELCFEDYCFACRTKQTSDSPGKCTGSARSCSSISESRCYKQQGCQYSVGATLSEYDDSCGGSARSCGSIYTQSSCEDQSGCSWQ